MLSRYLQNEYVADISETEFTEQWFNSYLAKGLAGGYIVEADFENLNTPITRIEVIRAFSFVYNMSKGTDLAEFDDVIDEDDSKMLKPFVDKGIILGDGDGNFRPNDKIKRGELAKVISLCKANLGTTKGNENALKAYAIRDEILNLLNKENISAELKEKALKLTSGYKINIKDMEELKLGIHKSEQTNGQSYGAFFVFGNSDTQKEEVSGEKPEPKPEPEVVPTPKPEVKYAPIVDEKLLYAINKTLDENRSGTEKVTIEEMESLVELDASIKLKAELITGYGAKVDKYTRGIKSIEGLETAVNLEKLILQENDISDLEPISKLTKLKYLNLLRNDIRDVEQLSELVNLEYLNLYSNQIADINPLSKLMKLTFLDVHFNNDWDGSGRLKDISVVVNMPELVKLDICSNSIIEDISAVKDLEKIQIFDFSGNAVKDVTPFADKMPELMRAMWDEGDGERSVGFAGQTIVGLSVTAEKGANTVRLPSPFVGLDEVVTEYVGEPYTFFGFGFVDGNEEVSYSEYDMETKEFILTIPENNTSEDMVLNIPLLQVGGELQWFLKDITITIPGTEAPVI
ncbi:MAG: hypothetical protein GXZ11_03150 [Tissierellia bacterium]|nr:hypothetical protein [Tissierellia bacterium]